MFSAPEKRIFQYHDGKNIVCADPLAIRRKIIQASHGTFDTIFKSASGDDPISGDQGADASGKVRQASAEDSLLAIVREVFGLDPFDRNTGAGCMDDHVFHVLNSFHEWLEKNAKAGGN